MRMLKTVTHFVFELQAELPPEESGNVVRLHGMNRRARQVLIDRLQIRLPAEDDVGGVLTLVHTPVVSGGEVPIDRAAAPGELVEPGMDSFGFPSVGDALSPLPVRNVAERIVGHSIVDAQLAQLACQPVMPVEADLQPARQPRRHSYMAEAQFLVHEIKVVMQTLAVIGNQKRLAGLLVVPWLVCRARLHGRENADQPRLFASFREDLFHPVFLTEVPFANELDFDAGLRRQPFRVLTNPVPERLGELRIVKYPDLSLVQ
jgi:hypothetical protein